MLLNHTRTQRQIFSYVNTEYLDICVGAIFHTSKQDLFPV